MGRDITNLTSSPVSLRKEQRGVLEIKSPLKDFQQSPSEKANLASQSQLDSNNTEDQCLRTKGFKLCNYEEAPAYLQHNPHIRTGYRVNFDLSLCCKSLVHHHNGKIKVWSLSLSFVLLCLNNTNHICLLQTETCNIWTRILKKQGPFRPV